MKQPSIRFFLHDRPNKDGERQILLSISLGYSVTDPNNSGRKSYKPFKISTRCRIKPEHFGKYIPKRGTQVHVFDEKIFNQYS